MSTSRSAAASATDRHIGPAQSWLLAIGRMPAPGTRPSVGLTPTRLWDVAGLRIEPSVSVPTVTVASPSAAAAPDPELDPLGLRLTSYGFSTCPPSDE